jgi:predicted RNA-binding protein with PIN domain
MGYPVSPPPGCPVTYLIDGYNLLHALGWASRRMPAGGLEVARRRLLDWLADAAPLKSGSATFRVVFDAQHGPAPSVGQSHRGVLVQFAYRATADDRIEELLDAEPAPGQVTVVSNDARLREAARRAGSRGWACREFVDWLLEVEQATPGSPRYRPPEKPDGPAPADEAAALLRAFVSPKPRPKG